jgi:hypothetical protein
MHGRISPMEEEDGNDHNDEIVPLLDNAKEDFCVSTVIYRVLRGVEKASDLLEDKLVKIRIVLRPEM